MRVTLTPEDKQVLYTTLAFANLKRIQSANQVLDLLKRLPPGLHIITHTHTRLKDIAALQGDQADLREWLTEIATLGKAACEKIGPEIARTLNDAGLQGCYGYSARGVFYEAKFLRSDLRVLCARSVALILNQQYGLVTRLGQCRQCDRFRLTLSGRPRTFCNEKHRLAWDSADAKNRVRRYRERLIQKLR